MAFGTPTYGDGICEWLAFGVPACDDGRCEH